jgi:hypothetical protein
MDRVSLPPYIETAGSSLFGSMPLLPPFEFEGVKMMVFPLKANISRLTEFCNSYLNLNLTGENADQADFFKPATPFVFMMLLHYDKMSSNITQTARNIGWISQHEITFTIPLEWWRWSGGAPHQGELEFMDWAIVSPFIFVDDFVSQFTGREVYGWPKVMGELRANLNFSLPFPTNPTEVLRFSTYTLPKYYQGQRTSRNLLMEVDYVPNSAFSTFPPNLSSPWFPLNVAAKATSSYLSSLGTLLDIGLSLRLRGFPSQQERAKFLFDSGKVALRYASEMSSGTLDPFSWWRMFATNGTAQDGKSRSPRHGKLSIQNITVKQFPDIERPHLACYQALVKSAMSTSRINKAGLLGDLNLSRADLSGGYSIRLHHSSLHPIVETLGLDSQSRERNASGETVHILEPILPYWSDVDLSYGLGEVLYSQALPNQMSKDLQRTHVAPAPQTPVPNDRRFFYNSIIGTAATPVHGPFTIPDMLVKVYPLAAKKKNLERYLANFNDLGLTYKDKPVVLKLVDKDGKSKPRVYLVSKDVDSNHGDIWASSESPDWLTDKSIEFFIPVQLHAGSYTSNTFLISPFVYNNSVRATIGDYEVNGRPTQKATIKSSYNDPRGDMKYQPSVYTELSIESFTSLGDGEQAVSNLLIEIVPKAETIYAGDESNSADFPENVINFEIDMIGFKQYRHAENATLACYQSIVTRSTTFTIKQEGKNSGLIRDSSQIKIHKSQSHPIVEMLGLETESVYYCFITNQWISVINPIVPFWIQVKAEEHLGKTIATRLSPDTPSGKTVVPGGPDQAQEDWHALRFEDVFSLNATSHPDTNGDQGNHVSVINLDLASLIENLSNNKNSEPDKYSSNI